MLRFIDRAIRTLLLAELRHFPMALTRDDQLTDLLSQSTDVIVWKRLMPVTQSNGEASTPIVWRVPTFEELLVFFWDSPSLW